MANELERENWELKARERIEKDVSERLQRRFWLALIINLGVLTTGGLALVSSALIPLKEIVAESKSEMKQLEKDIDNIKDATMKAKEVSTSAEKTRIASEEIRKDLLNMESNVSQLRAKLIDADTSILKQIERLEEQTRLFSFNKILLRFHQMAIAPDEIGNADNLDPASHAVKLAKFYYQTSSERPDPEDLLIWYDDAFSKNRDLSLTAIQSTDMIPALETTISIFEFYFAASLLENPQSQYPDEAVTRLLDAIEDPFLANYARKIALDLLLEARPIPRQAVDRLEAFVQAATNRIHHPDRKTEYVTEMLASETESGAIESRWIEEAANRIEEDERVILETIASMEGSEFVNLWWAENSVEVRLRIYEALLKTPVEEIYLAAAESLGNYGATAESVAPSLKNLIGSKRADHENPNTNLIIEELCSCLRRISPFENSSATGELCDDDNRIELEGV